MGTQSSLESIMASSVWVYYVIINIIYYHAKVRAIYHSGSYTLLCIGSSAIVFKSVGVAANPDDYNTVNQ